MAQKRAFLDKGLKALVVVTALIVVVSLFSGCDENSSSRSTTTPRTSTSARITTQTQWFQGGTLHRATLAQWRASTYANRLATAGDWLAATQWKGHLNSPSDFDRARVKAQMLMNAVNEIASDQDLGFMSAAETAAAILTMSNDLGP